MAQKRPAASKKAAAGKPAAATRTAGKTPARAKRPVVPNERNKAEPVLLSGGNPQIAMGYGDEPVQAYIAAMPGWKHDVGRLIDDLIVRTVPDVAKAVKWNTPFYGVESGSWFLAVHCYTRYVQVTFFRGTSLDPVPPGESKTPGTRYLNIHEAAPLDQAQFTAWVDQARRLPGERL